MLACTALVGCSNEDEPVVNNGTENGGKGEESYIAVNLKSARIESRADGATYEDGKDNENAVSKVLFFFFDANGNAYAVDGTNNYLEKGIEMQAESSSVNVEEISKSILVIEKSKNVPPQQILAVLNAPEALKKTQSLDDLQKLIGAYNGSTGAFVMSNSVYKHAATGKVVVATELTASNIAATSEAAMAAPVDIYVERVAAKVRVTASYAANATSFDTGVTTTDNKKIYAKIQGWKVTNIKSQAYLLKSIDVDWTDANLGFVWNDAPYFRSYWANTATTGDVTHPWKWSELTNAVADTEAADNWDYYYENTDANTMGTDAEGADVETAHKKSQLLVAADFVDADGAAITIAEWFGAKYTIPALKTAIANSVKSQIYIKDGNSATSIADTDIDFFQELDNAADNRYLSYAKLATASESKSFVKADGTTTMTKDEVNTILKAVRPAKIWNEGGYYYMDIKHLGAKAGDVGEFGLVRNHLYDITISGITGLGTPVYDPEKVITPEKPEDDESFIAARINILAWRVVKQENVVLQ